jgi:hypothetical protein
MLISPATATEKVDRPFLSTTLTRDGLEIGFVWAIGEAITGGKSRGKHQIAEDDDGTRQKISPFSINQMLGPNYLLRRPALYR